MANESKAHDALEIQCLPQGGYVVREGYQMDGGYRGAIVAFSEMADLLNWISLNLAARPSVKRTTPEHYFDSMRRA